MTVRLAEPADLPSLVELMREFHAEAGYSLNLEAATNAFLALLNHPAYGAAWILLDGSIAAGYVVLTLRFSMEYGGVDAFIDDLFVKPAYRRRGLGRRGLTALFQECERRGVAAVHVIVGADNVAAKALYASFGLLAPSDEREMLTVPLSRAQ